MERTSLAAHAAACVGRDRKPRLECTVMVDQRGVVRPYGNGVDIGAFESEYNVLRFTDINRVSSTNVHMQVQGLPGSVCTIQASSNFLNWDDVFASSNGTTGIWDFVDQDAGNHPNRFYRAFIDNQ